MREDCKKKQIQFQVHDEKNVKLVTQHPVNSSYFASAGKDGLVVGTLKYSLQWYLQGSQNLRCQMQDTMFLIL